MSPSFWGDMGRGRTILDAMLAPNLGHLEEAGSRLTAKLSSPQGFMDEGVHAMLLRILRMEE